MFSQQVCDFVNQNNLAILIHFIFWKKINHIVICGVKQGNLSTFAYRFIIFWKFKMDNREKRPIFDLKKSNSLNSSISIKDPVTGRNVLDEILQDPAENYKVIKSFTHTSCNSHTHSHTSSHPPTQLIVFKMKMLMIETCFYWSNCIYTGLLLYALKTI